MSHLLCYSIEGSFLYVFIFVYTSEALLMNLIRPATLVTLVWMVDRRIYLV